jgi:hypothetical protein
VVTWCSKVRYFRKIRAASVAATLRKKLERQAAHPRPTPKVVPHIEDVLYQNGLRFVRPGQPDRILGITPEGIPVPERQ